RRAERQRVWWPGDRDLLVAVAFQAVRSLSRRTIDQYFTLGDQLLHAGAADFCLIDLRKLGGEILVQTLPRAIRGDDDSQGTIWHLHLEGKLNAATKHGSGLVLASAPRSSATRSIRRPLPAESKSTAFPSSGRRRLRRGRDRRAETR